MSGKSHEDHDRSYWRGRGGRVDMLEDWELTGEEVDENTVALYRANRGDEVEIREETNFNLRNLDLTENEYRVVYDADIDDERWSLMYVISSHDFVRLDEAFDYAFKVLMGREPQEDMIPDEYGDVYEDL